MRTYYPTINKSVTYPTGTLCFWCQNSVPDRQGHGCSWSCDLKPVAGWIATHVIRNHQKRGGESYCVHKCPQFVEEVIPKDRLSLMEDDI